MRLSMALSAALAALLLGGAALVGPTAAAVAAVAVIAVIAWGWPRQMGAPARTSLSVTLLLAGALAVVLMLVWPQPDGTARLRGLFEPLAVVLAWGTIAAFVVQLVRGTGRPLRLESTVATMGGVLICVMTACWVAVARAAEATSAASLVMTLGLTVSLVALLGLTPWMQGRPGVLALVVIPVSGLAAWGATVAAGVAPAVVPACVVAALAASTLVSLTAATAPSSRPRLEDRPVGTTLRPRRAGFALAMAPVGAAGVIGHVMVGFLG